MANMTRRGELEGGLLGPLDPFRMLREMMQADPFSGMAPLAGGERSFAPRVEVKETKDGFLFHADLPGVRGEDVDISVTGNRLTISGKREEERRQEDERYFAYERSYGDFSRSFVLPEGVNLEGVQADMKDGVLSVIVPKRAEVQPKKIPVGGVKTAEQGRTGDAATTKPPESGVKSGEQRRKTG